MSENKVSSMGIKNVVIDTLIYGVCQSLVRVLNFITFPLLARHFSVSDYGKFDFAMVTVSLIVIACIFGQDAALARYFFDFKDKDDKKAVISQSFIIQLIFMLICILALIFATAPLASVGYLNYFSKIELLLLCLQIPFFLIINFAQNILKCSFEKSKFLFLSAGVVIAVMTLSIIGTVFYDFNLQTFFAGYLVINVIFALLGLIFVRHWITLKWSTIQIYPLLKFAIPFGVITVGTSLSPSLERILIMAQNEWDMLGQFAIATKVALIITILLNAFQTAFRPFAYSILDRKDASALFSRILRLFLLVFGIAVISLMAILPNIIFLLVEARYFAAISLAPIIIMAFYIEGITGITDINISISKRTNLVIWPLLVYFFTFFCIFYFLGSYLGIMALLYGMLFGQLGKLFLMTYISHKVAFPRWSFKLIIAQLTYLMLVTLIYISFIEEYMTTIQIMTFISAILFILVWVIFFFTHDDKKVIKNQIIIIFKFLQTGRV